MLWVVLRCLFVKGCDKIEEGSANWCIRLADLLVICTSGAFFYQVPVPGFLHKQGASTAVTFLKLKGVSHDR